MSNMKCPFCQQELKPQTMDGEWLECWNCSYHEPSHHPFPQRILCGTKELWQELIRTRKALDVAVEELTKIKVAAESVGIGFFMTAAIFALAKIKTALEQKDVK